MAKDRSNLGDDPAFHLEQSIAALHDAIWRVVRGVEILDLALIQSAREKLDESNGSLARAIESRARKAGLTREP